MGDVKTTLTWLLRDQVSGQAKQIEGTLGKLGLKTKTAGSNMLLLAGAATAVAGTMFELVKAAAEDEAGMARLTAAVKANVAGWNGDVDAIGDMISAHEELSFSSDDLVNSMTLLVAATHNVDKAYQLQATAMDLARFSGISLEAASQELIKVQAGQFKSLKGLGIVLKDGATATEALAAVQRTTAGQSAAYADSIVGKTERLGIAFDDLKVEGGEALMNIAQGWRTLLDVTTDVNNRMAANMLTGLKATANTGEQFGPPFTRALEKGMIPALQTLKDFPRHAAQSLLDGRSSVFSAAAQLAATEAEPFLSNGDLRRALNGEGSLGKQLINGLNSKRPAVREAARALRTDIINALTRGGAIEVVVNPVAEAGHPGGGRASGGPVMPGQTYTVGEHGPETLVMGGGSGTVVPNGGGGFTIQGVSAAQIADMVDRELYFRFKRTGLTQRRV